MPDDLDLYAGKGRPARHIQPGQGRPGSSATPEPAGQPVPESPPVAGGPAPAPVDSTLQGLTPHSVGGSGAPAEPGPTGVPIADKAAQSVQALGQGIAALGQAAWNATTHDQTYQLPDGRTMTVRVFTPEATKELAAGLVSIGAVEATGGLAALAMPAFSNTIRGAPFISRYFFPMLRQIARIGASSGGAAAGMAGAGGSSEEIVRAAEAGVLAEGATGLLRGAWRFLHGSTTPFSPGTIEPMKTTGMVPGAEAADEVLRPYGVNIPPGVAHTGSGVSYADTIARYGLFGRGIMESQTKATQVAARDAAETLAKQFYSGLPKEAVADLTRDAASGGLRVWRAAERGMYTQLDDLMWQLQPGTTRKDLGVPIKNAVKLAQDIFAKATKEGVEVPGSTTITSRKVAEALLRRPDGTLRPEMISWDEFGEIISEFGGYSRRTGTEALSNRAKGTVDQIIRELKRSADVTAREVGTPFKKALDEARAFSAAGHQRFNTNFVEGVVKADPGLAMEGVLRGKNPEGIKTVVELVQKHDPSGEVLQKVRGEFLNNWLLESVDTATQQISGTKAAGLIQGYGEESLKALFPEEVVSRIHKVSDALRLAGQEPGAKQFSMAITMTQMGAVATLATAGVAGEAYGYTGAGAGGVGLATAVLLGPRALAMIMTSRPAYNMLVKGLQAPAGTREATKLGSQMFAFLASHNLVNEVLQDNVNHAQMSEALIRQAAEEPPEPELGTPENPIQVQGIPTI